MKTQVEGFALEVVVEDGRPHVRINHPSGQTLVDTSAVSVTGLERLQRVFGVAARQAGLALEGYYTKMAHEEDVKSRRKDTADAEPRR